MKFLLSVFLVFATMSSFAQSTSYKKGFEEGKNTCNDRFLKCEVKFIMWEEETISEVHGVMTNAEGIETLLSSCNDFATSGREACRKSILAGKGKCTTLD